MVRSKVPQVTDLELHAQNKLDSTSVQELIYAVNEQLRDFPLSHECKSLEEYANSQIRRMNFLGDYLGKEVILPKPQGIKSVPVQEVPGTNIKLRVLAGNFYGYVSPDCMASLVIYTLDNLRSKKIIGYVGAVPNAMFDIPKDAIAPMISPYNKAIPSPLYIDLRKIGYWCDSTDIFEQFRNEPQLAGQLRPQRIGLYMGN